MSKPAVPDNMQRSGGKDDLMQATKTKMLNVFKSYGVSEMNDVWRCEDEVTQVYGKWLSDSFLKCTILYIQYELFCLANN